MNVVYGLTLYEFSEAQVDRASRSCNDEIMSFAFPTARAKSWYPLNWQSAGVDQLCARLLQGS